MGALKLYNYDDNYAETYINFAQMQFYNYVNGTVMVDDDGVRWSVSASTSDDVKVVTLTPTEEYRVSAYTTAKLNALGIYGLTGVGDANIAVGGYTGDAYGISDNSPDVPWMQLISLDGQGTHIKFRNPSNSQTHDDIIGLFNDGKPLVACPLAIKYPYNDEVKYGWICTGYYGPGAGSSRIALCIVDWLDNSIWGDLTLDPGDDGYVPTGTHYDSDLPGIGGSGHGGIPSGDGHKMPGYESDVITNPSRPDESVASVIGAGLIHPYLITESNLSALTACLYSTTLATALINLAINPLDFIVSLNIFPCVPDAGTATNVVLGKWACDLSEYGLGTSVQGRPLSKQFKTFSFGTLHVYENWGSFLDYSNTKVELYLPFIGFVDLETSEVMGGAITVDYTIDFLTGMCVANVNCVKVVHAPDGYGYPQYSQHSYQGNCAMSVPLGQMQYGQMIGSIINAGTSAMRNPANGIITLAGEFASGGFAPQTASKGSIVANAGFCSVLYPYLRITRPISAEPNSYQDAMGYPSYINSSLSECSGLCVCKAIDLRGLTGATDSEIERIRQMCLEGVHV